MNLSAPTKPIWIIAAVLGILGLVGHFVSIPVVTPYQFWFVTVGWALLTLATILKGL